MCTDIVTQIQVEAHAKANNLRADFAATRMLPSFSLLGENSFLSISTCRKTYSDRNLAAEMDIHCVLSIDAVRVTMTTYEEKRSGRWWEEACNNQLLANPVAGPPDIWAHRPQYPPPCVQSILINQKKRNHDYHIGDMVVN